MSQKQILIVEDNKSVMEILKRSFHKDTNFNLYTTSNLKGANHILKYNHIDLAVLDLQLPDGNGLDLCKTLKTGNIGPKVIILTSRSEISTRIKSFEYGADDYLAKPFYPEELLIRVEKLLGLLDDDSTEIVYKNLKLITTLRSLYIGKIQIKLTSREFLILECLMSNPQSGTTKQLQKYLSSHTIYKLDINALRVSIKRLRDKLQKESGQEIIKSRFGWGYYI